MHAEGPPDDARPWDHVRPYDGGTERPSEAVLAAVAQVTGRDVMVGEPLYTAVDPDALDALTRTDGHGQVGVSFTYLGCLIHADDEAVRVSRFDGSGSK